MHGSKAKQLCCIVFDCFWQQAAKEAQLTFQMAVRFKFELSPFCLIFMFSIWRESRVSRQSMPTLCLPSFALHCVPIRASQRRERGRARGRARTPLSVSAPSSASAPVSSCLPANARECCTVQYSTVRYRCAALPALTFSHTISTLPLSHPIPRLFIYTPPCSHHSLVLPESQPSPTSFLPYDHTFSIRLFTNNSRSFASQPPKVFVNGHHSQFVPVTDIDTLSPVTE